MDQNKLGNLLQTKIKHYRKQKGLNLPQLASLSGISVSQLSRLESGENTNPSAIAVINIINALEVSFDTFLDETKEDINDGRILSLSYRSFRKLSSVRQTYYVHSGELIPVREIIEELVSECSLSDIENVLLKSNALQAEKPNSSELHAAD